MGLHGVVSRAFTSSHEGPGIEPAPDDIKSHCFFLQFILFLLSDFKNHHELSTDTRVISGRGPKA